MEFGNVISAGRAVLSGSTPVSLHVHVSSLGSTWLASQASGGLVPTPSPPWCSVPLAVTRVEAPDQLCSVTYRGTPQLLTQGTQVRQVHT